MIFKLIIKESEVGNIADTPNSLGINPYYRKFGSPHRPKKIWPLWGLNPRPPNPEVVGSNSTVAKFSLARGNSQISINKGVSAELPSSGTLIINLNITPIPKYGS